jgi:DNA-directed RNA polymerase specialized sigma24 family protein
MIVNAIMRLHMYEDRTISNGAQEHPAIFAARFARCRGLLRFIASRVLGSGEEAENAVQSCWLTASRNPPKFQFEGAFRSWLLRIQIDEALIILREKEQSTSDGNAGNNY